MTTVWLPRTVCVIGLIVLFTGCQPNTPVGGNAAAPAAPGAMASDDGSTVPAPVNVPSASTAPGPSGMDYTIWGAKKEPGGVKLYYRRDTAGSPMSNYRLLLETPGGDVIYADLGRSFGHLDQGVTTELSLSLGFAGVRGSLEGATLRIVRQDRLGMMHGAADTSGAPASNTIPLEVPPSMAGGGGAGSGSGSGGSAPAAPRVRDPETIPPHGLPFEAHDPWRALQEEFGKAKIAVIFLEDLEKVDGAEVIHQKVNEYKTAHPDAKAYEVITRHKSVILVAPATDLTATANALGLGSISATDSFQNTVTVKVDKSLFKLTDAGIVEDENHPEFFAKTLEKIEELDSEGMFKRKELAAIYKRLLHAGPDRCADEVKRDIVRHLHRAFNRTEHPDREVRVVLVECLAQWDPENSGEEFLSRLRELARDRFFAQEEEGEQLIASLGQLKEEEAIETLGRLITSTADFGGPNRKFIEPAADALIEIGPASEEEAQDLVRHNDPEVCLTGIRILAEIGTKRSIDLLSQANSKSPNREVRDAARSAMKDIRARGASSGE